MTQLVALPLGGGEGRYDLSSLGTAVQLLLLSAGFGKPGESVRSSTAAESTSYSDLYFFRTFVCVCVCVLVCACTNTQVWSSNLQEEWLSLLPPCEFWDGTHK